MNFINSARTIVLALILTLIGSMFTAYALAEDNTVEINQQNAKVGAENTYVSWHRDADGFVYENIITCTRVGKSKTVCKTFDHDGWLETMVCNIKNQCKVMASR